MTLYTAKYLRAGFMCAAIFFLASCNSKKDKFKNLRPYENNLGIKPAKLAQIDTIHFTTIKWLEPNRNFGTLTEGDTVLFTYKFKNTGEHPLFISGVKAECGCTRIQYPEKPIWPDEEGELLVKFDSFEESGDVYKTLIVTTNTSNKVHHVLSFHGHVNEKTRPK